jgi:hypothetical protein
MARSLRSCAAAAAAAVSLLTLTYATPAQGSVVWRADAERPLSQEWANFSCADASRITQVASPSAQGNAAYRVDLHDGDRSYGERCELGMGSPTRAGFPVFSEGEESWIGYQVYIPAGFPSDGWKYNVITQFKNVNDLCAPALSVHVEQGQLLLFHSADNGSSCGGDSVWSAPMHYGRWIKLLFHIQWSSDPAKGSVELFGDMDGSGITQLMPRTPMFTMKMDPSGATLPVGARLGIYRDTAIAGDATAYFDGFTIATDRASAESVAFGNGALVPPVAPVITPPDPGTAPPPADWARPPTPPVSTDSGTAGTRPPRTCRVPRVVNHRLNVARIMLKRAGCADHARRRHSSHRSRGRVLRQSVRPGAVVPAGTPVQLVVGSSRTRP